MIKNQHGDSLDGIDASEVRLILFAVPRSGSAWLWQMVGDVLGDGVFRTHRYVLCDLNGLLMEEIELLGYGGHET